MPSKDAIISDLEALALGDPPTNSSTLKACSNNSAIDEGKQIRKKQMKATAKELGVEGGEFCSTGATPYTYRYRSRAQDRSLKKGDSPYKNRRLYRNDEDWPYLVEAGNSEKSLDHLKAAAK